MTKEQRRPLRARLLGKEQRRSIRARLLALTLIPSSALLALWIGFTVAPVNNIITLNQGATFTEEVGVPALEVIADLQTERRSTMEYLALSESGDGENTLPANLRQARTDTDATVAEFRASLEETRPSSLPPESRDRIDHLITTLDVLTPHREVLDSSTPIRSGASSAYDEAIEAALQLWDIQEELVDAEQTPQVRSLTSLLRARELLSQEDALLAYSNVSGTFTTADHIDFSAAVGGQRYLYTQIAPELTGEERAAYDEVIGSAQFRTVQSLENETITNGATTDGLPVNAQAWTSARQTLDQSFQELEEDRTTAILERSRAEATQLTILLAVISALALAVVVASMVFSSRIVAWLNQRLGALREATLDYAHTRLPEVTKRLRAGEQVDLATAAPPIPVDVHDEIGQVTEAFNTAQRAAVDSATQEAQLREGVRNVFRNIARRAQTLVHRQLSLLDSLEQSETDPAVLESLFRIDHLSTQMRRNAENLMLLTDDRLSRRAGEPLSLAHAVRAASSEIEDYSRVKLLPMPDVRLRGAVAGDTVRLLAELLENAAAFSPPTTSVTVRGEALAHGSYALEVEDRGLGMLPDAYAEANALLAGTSRRFSLADMREDSQLGLVVVATIAQRHGLKVTLRASPYNGTQAIVVLPPEVITDEPAPAVEPPTRGTRAELEAVTSPVPAVPPGPASHSAAAPDMASPPPRTAEPTADSADTYKGLPRRRRSRARHRSAEPAAPAPPTATPPGPDRSLEEIRQMMSAFQRGSQYGRTPDTSDPTNTEAR